MSRQTQNRFHKPIPPCLCPTPLPNKWLEGHCAACMKSIDAKNELNNKSNFRTPSPDFKLTYKLSEIGHESKVDFLPSSVLLKYIHKNYASGSTSGLNTVQDRMHKRSYTGKTNIIHTSDMSSSRDRSTSPVLSRSPNKFNSRSPGKLFKNRQSKHTQSTFAIRNSYMYGKDEESTTYTPTDSVVYKDKLTKFPYESIMHSSKESLLKDKLVSSSENLYKNHRSPLRNLEDSESSIKHSISQKTVQSLNANIIKLKKNLSVMNETYIPHRSRPIFLSQSNLYRNTSKLEKIDILDGTSPDSPLNSSPMFSRPKSTTRFKARRSPLLSLNTFRDSESTDSFLERNSSYSGSIFEENRYLGIQSFGKVHKSSVNSILLEGNVLYSASSDFTIMKWNLRDDYDDMNCNERIKAHKRAIHAICRVNERLLISGSADKQIKIWKTDPSFQLKHTLKGHEGAVRSLVSPTSTTLISSSNDGRIRIWDLNSFQFTGSEYREHIRPVTCLTLCNSNTLLSGSEDCTVKLWDTRSHWSIATYSDHIEPVTSCCMWDDYSFLSSSKDGTVKKWDLRTCGILQTISADEEIYAIKRIRGKLVMAGRNIKIWDSSFVFSSEKHSSIRCMETLSDESILISSCGDGSITVIYMQNWRVKF